MQEKKLSEEGSTALMTAMISLAKNYYYLVVINFYLRATRRCCSWRPVQQIPGSFPGLFQGLNT